MKHCRRSIGVITELIHLLAGFHELRQPVCVDLRRRPMRMQDLQPAFPLEHSRNVERVIFVRQLFDLVSNRAISDVFDVIIFFRRVVTGLRSLLQRPGESRRKTQRTNQPRRIFNKRIIVQNADQLGFDISRAVERIHQQPARTRIQRQRHRIYREIAAPQVFDEGRRSHNRRLARLLIALGSRAAYLRTHAPRQSHIDDMEVLVRAANHGACTFQFFLQLEWISLNREIEIADRMSADNVAHRSAGEVNVHPGSAGNILYQRDALLLIRRQPQFHCVDVVSHSWS